MKNAPNFKNNQNIKKIENISKKISQKNKQILELTKDLSELEKKSKNIEQRIIANREDAIIIADNINKSTQIIDSLQFESDNINNKIKNWTASNKEKIKLEEINRKLKAEKNILSINNANNKYNISNNEVINYEKTELESNIESKKISLEKAKKEIENEKIVDITEDNDYKGDNSCTSVDKACSIAKDKAIEGSLIADSGIALFTNTSNNINNINTIFNLTKYINKENENEIKNKKEEIKKAEKIIDKIIHDYLRILNWKEKEKIKDISSLLNIWQEDFIRKTWTENIDIKLIENYLYAIDYMNDSLWSWWFLDYQNMLNEQIDEINNSKWIINFEKLTKNIENITKNQLEININILIKDNNINYYNNRLDKNKKEFIQIKDNKINYDNYNYKDKSTDDLILYLNLLNIHLKNHIAKKEINQIDWIDLKNMDNNFKKIITKDKDPKTIWLALKWLLNKRSHYGEKNKNKYWNVKFFKELTKFLKDNPEQRSIFLQKSEITESNENNDKNKFWLKEWLHECTLLSALLKEIRTIQMESKKNEILELSKELYNEKWQKQLKSAIEKEMEKNWDDCVLNYIKFFQTFDKKAFKNNLFAKDRKKDILSNSEITDMMKGILEYKKSSIKEEIKSIKEKIQNEKDPIKKEELQKNLKKLESNLKKNNKESDNLETFSKTTEQNQKYILNNLERYKKAWMMQSVLDDIKEWKNIKEIEIKVQKAEKLLGIDSKIIWSSKENTISTQNYSFSPETWTISLSENWIEKNITLTPAERLLIDQYKPKNPNEENLILNNIVDFYKTLERIWLSKLWTIKDNLFKSIQNAKWIWFKIDKDYLNENEIKIFLNSILKSVWEDEISPMFTLNNFISVIEQKNKTQIWWNEAIVNTFYWETYLENKLFSKFIPREWTIIWFNRTYFEKSIFTNKTTNEKNTTK